MLRQQKIAQMELEANLRILKILGLVLIGTSVLGVVQIALQQGVLHAVSFTFFILFLAVIFSFVFGYLFLGESFSDCLLLIFVMVTISLSLRGAVINSHIQQPKNKKPIEVKESLLDRKGIPLHLGFSVTYPHVWNHRVLAETAELESGKTPGSSCSDGAGTAFART